MGKVSGFLFVSQPYVRTRAVTVSSSIFQREQGRKAGDEARL